jgi:hypothetical protein
MSNVFDLSKISRLVDSQHPARILVMDTNIIMNDPNPNNWSVKAGGQSLFVLSDTVVLELASIRQKKGSTERLESSHKADIASKSLASLFGQGSITEGIPVKAGWVVCVPSPKKDELDPELDQLKDIIDVLKRSDTKLLLLTRECHQLFRSTPVTLLTGDWDLYNIVQAQGVPCHLSSSFPIKGLKEAAAITTPVDWDKELAEIQAKIAKNSIVVEATLTAQRSAPPWLMLLTGTKRFRIAEGRGVMRIGNEVRPFLWTIPFYPQTLEPRSSDDNEGLTDLPPIHLDFFGGDNFEQDLFDAIADRLLDCTNLSFEEGKPTLQSPESTMEMLLYFEYLLREGMSEGGLEKLRQEIKESEGLANYWTDWILDIEDGDERHACLEGFIEALNNCWEIGQTYTFSIIWGQEECLPE